MFDTAKIALASAALSILSIGPVLAETALEKATAEGQRLSAEEISAKIVGHTITARAKGKTFLFYYGTDNTLTGRMIDGGWKDAGYFGITDDDRVCLSMTPDKGRLRCMSLVARDGVVQKFNTAGDLTFELLSFEEGNRL